MLLEYYQYLENLDREFPEQIRRPLVGVYIFQTKTVPAMPLGKLYLEQIWRELSLLKQHSQQRQV